MRRPVIKDMDEFKKLCTPVVAYLRKNCDPYIEVYISMDNIKVTSDESGIPIFTNGKQCEGKVYKRGYIDM